MKKLMHILFLSCLKASALIEKKFHIKLSFTEQMQLKAHKMMCDVCSRYEKQSLILEKGIERHVHQRKDEIDMDQLKKKITIQLNEVRK